MKITSYLILSFFALNFFFACDSKQVKHANKELNDISSESSGTSNACLLDYATKYQELLSLKQAAQIADKPQASAETEYSKMINDPAFHSLTYEWKGVRKKQIEFSGIKTVVPVADYIKISGMKAITEEKFDLNYSKKTEAEIADISQKLDKAFDDALNKKSQSEKANEAGKKIEEAGISKSEAKKAMGTIKESAIVKTLRAYEPFNGLGNKASWNTFESRLYVLKSGVMFYIECDLSEDKNFNKTKAIEAAKLVLAKCE